MKVKIPKTKLSLKKETSAQRRKLSDSYHKKLIEAAIKSLFVSFSLVKCGFDPKMQISNRYLDVWKSANIEKRP